MIAWCVFALWITTARWQSSRSIGTRAAQHRILGVGRLVKSHARNEGEVAVWYRTSARIRAWAPNCSGVYEVARDEKLARVDAEILPDNLPMKKIAKRLGFRTSDARGSNLNASRPRPLNQSKGV